MPAELRKKSYENVELTPMDRNLKEIAEERVRKAELRLQEQADKRERDEAFGGRLWFKNLSEEDYKSLIAHLRVQGLEALKARLFEKRGDQKMVQRAFIEAMDDLAKSHKTTESYYELWHGLFKDREDRWTSYDSENTVLVSIIEWWVDQARTKKLGNNHRARNVHDGLRNLAETARGTLPKKGLFDGLILSGIAQTAISKSVTYNEVNVKVKDVLHILSSVTVELLNAEDKYFVDNITGSYLPEIIRCADLAKNLEGDARKEAGTNFMAQLDLIEEKLTRIQSEASNKVLIAVRSQTQFLAEAITKAELPSGIEVH